MSFLVIERLDNQYHKMKFWGQHPVQKTVNHLAEKKYRSEVTGLEIEEARPKIQF